MNRNGQHTSGEQDNACQHPEPAAALIGHGAKEGSEHPHKRARRNDEGQGREVHTQTTCKYRQEWVHHPVHRIQDGAHKHEDDELIADTHVVFAAWNVGKNTIKDIGKSCQPTYRRVLI